MPERLSAVEGLKLVPEGQPAAGAGDLFAKKNQNPPFKIENIGRNYADDDQGKPEGCFVIHGAYWPVLWERTSLVCGYGELSQQRFDFGNDVFGCDAKMRIKIGDRGGGAEAFHPHKIGLFRIATLAR